MKKSKRKKLTTLQRIGTTRPLPIKSQQELTKLKKKIVESYSASQKLSTSAKERMADAVKEAILCGDYLNKAKKFVGHGGWLSWLKKNCKGIKHATASNYMRLANFQHRGKLESTTSLRKAYIATGIIEEPKRLPPPATDAKPVHHNGAVRETPQAKPTAEAKPTRRVAVKSEMKSRGTTVPVVVDEKDEKDEFIDAIKQLILRVPEQRRKELWLEAIKQIDPTALAGKPVVG